MVRLLRFPGGRARRSLLSLSEHTVIPPEIATLADLPFLALSAMKHRGITGSVAGSNETNYVELFRRGTMKFPFMNLSFSVACILNRVD